MVFIFELRTLKLKLHGPKEENQQGEFEHLDMAEESFLFTTDLILMLDLPLFHLRCHAYDSHGLYIRHLLKKSRMSTRETRKTAIIDSYEVGY